MISFLLLAIPLKSELAYEIFDKGQVRFWLQAEHLSPDSSYRFIINDREVADSEVSVCECGFGGFRVWVKVSSWKSAFWVCFHPFWAVEGWQGGWEKAEAGTVQSFGLGYIRDGEVFKFKPITVKKQQSTF